MSTTTHPDLPTLNASLRCRHVAPFGGAYCTLPALHDGPHQGRTWTTRDEVSWPADPRPASAPYTLAMDALGGALMDLAAARLRDELTEDGWSVDRLDYDETGYSLVLFDHGDGRKVRSERAVELVVGPLAAALAAPADPLTLGSCEACDRRPATHVVTVGPEAEHLAVCDTCDGLQ